MSDGGKRSSSYCKCRGIGRNCYCISGTGGIIVVNKQCSPLLRWIKLRCSICSPSPTRRPPQDPRPTIALEHTLWNHPVDSQRTEPDTSILEGYTTEHFTHGVRICHILFESQCIATQGESGRSGERRCGSEGSGALKLSAKTEQYRKPGNWCLRADMGRLHHDADYRFESAVRE